jgi:hypothetical protein
MALRVSAIVASAFSFERPSLALYSQVGRNSEPRALTVRYLGTAPLPSEPNWSTSQGVVLAVATLEKGRLWRVSISPKYPAVASLSVERVTVSAGSDRATLAVALGVPE